MATTNDVIVTINDGALGLSPAQTDNIQVKLGVCSSGTPNTLTFFNDIKTLVATCGTGAAVEAAAHNLVVAGGPVGVMPITASVAGTTATVVQTGTGPAMTVSGAPLDAYEPIVRIVAGGTVTNATFQYALDATNPGGPTYGPVLSTASTYVVPGTGITLAFPAGTYVAGTTYTIPVTPPGYTSTDVNTAFTALLADAREWGGVHLVGQAASGTASATMASVVSTNMGLAETNYRYGYAILEAPTVNAADGTAIADSALISAFANFASTRVVIAAGAAELTSAITGRTQARPAAWPIAARAAAVGISEDLAYPTRGNLRSVVSLLRDERVTSGLDATRFATLRTIIGQPGFYVYNGNVMAAAGSDFGLLQRRRVMDRACKTARDALMRFLSASLRTNANGTIYELDARNIEAYVSGNLNAALTQPGHASEVSVVVSRTQNLLATQVLPVTVRVVPLGYAKTLTLDIGFANPSLAAKAS